MGNGNSACGHATNANGNCFSSGCWNSNSKRHEDGRGGPVEPIAPMPDTPPPTRD